MLCAYSSFHQNGVKFKIHKTYENPAFPTAHLTVLTLLAIIRLSVFVGICVF